jgi:GT2 family glycosyltransferase
MISILIPVYNFNIVRLVTELQRQAVKASVPFEIIVIDDCSSSLLSGQNKDVGKLPGVRFYELDANIGRARIRNRLAEMAVYSSLLFMDCDSEVPSENYINDYLNYCNQQIVVCGGRTYKEDPPEEVEYMLRWLYGIHKEQIPAVVRNKNPYRSFMTCNFMIPKPVFLQIQFDESIVLYGHEDTLFGLELRKKGIPVIHIQNPLIHLGLDIAREFLRKTDEGIENLLTLVEAGKIHHEDICDIHLLRTYEILKRYRLVNAYLFLYNSIANMVTKNLLGSYPRMFIFNLYKLSLFSRMMKKRKPNI